MTQSIEEKIQNGYYKNSRTLPLRKRINEFICYSCDSSLKKEDVFCSKCGSKVKEHIEKQIKEYKEDVELYKEEESRMYDLFKKECLDDVGYLDHPKTDLIFSKAWIEGHSDGHLAVYQELCELCSFLNEFIA